MHLKELDLQVIELEKEIQRWHRENADSRKLSEIPGIGPITACALVASIGDARQFANGRELAAWLGLVPRQHSKDSCYAQTIGQDRLPLRGQSNCGSEVSRLSVAIHSSFDGTLSLLTG